MNSDSAVRFTAYLSSQMHISGGKSTFDKLLFLNFCRLLFISFNWHFRNQYHATFISSYLYYLLNSVEFWLIPCVSGLFFAFDFLSHLIGLSNGSKYHVSLPISWSTADIFTYHDDSDSYLVFPGILVNSSRLLKLSRDDVHNTQNSVDNFVSGA